MQDWIGGSALLWKHHHVLMHHAYTNVDGDDPDITGEIVRFHALTRWHGHHKWQERAPTHTHHERIRLTDRGDFTTQAMYTWALLPLLGLRWHFSEIMDLVRMNHLGRPISQV